MQLDWVRHHHRELLKSNSGKIHKKNSFLIPVTRLLNSQNQLQCPFFLNQGQKDSGHEPLGMGCNIYHILCLSFSIIIFTDYREKRLAAFSSLIVIVLLGKVLLKINKVSKIQVYFVPELWRKFFGKKPELLISLRCTQILCWEQLHLFTVFIESFSHWFLLYLIYFENLVSLQILRSCTYVLMYKY